MTVVAYKAPQDQGKTSSMVMAALYLLEKGGYKGDEVFGNITFNYPGYHHLSNTELKSFMRYMVQKGGLKHKVILCDEADRLFPARSYKDKDQTDTLLGLWQDMKLFCWFLYTCHLGTSVDLILRQSTQITCLPRYDKLKDEIELTVLNGVYLTKFVETWGPVSKLWTPTLIYDRWEVIS